MKRILFVFLCVLAAGCAPKVYQYQNSPDESELAPYGKPGDCAVHGQAYLKAKDGTIHYAAHIKVILVPVTDYTTEWYRVGVLKQEVVPPFDPAVVKYVREATGDLEGKFTFSHVPAGKYYLASDINWYTGRRYEGGTAYATVTLSKGDNAEVVVTRP